MSELALPFITLDQAPLDGEQVLLRTDFNVPMDDAAKSIVDDDRIRASVPTILQLIDRGASIVIGSHMGRPKGGHDASLSLRPVSERLAELLDQDVQFLPESIGKNVKDASRQLQSGSIAMLENLRFHRGETANDLEFARQLVIDSMARILVQDAFGVLHRKQASTDMVPRLLPAYAGLHVAEEYAQITRAIDDPLRPLTVIMGGSKVSDKTELMMRFIDKADRIIVGGAIASNILAYKGVDVGKSKTERGTKVLDKIYRAVAEKVGSEHVDAFIVLPLDVGVENAHGARIECLVDEIPSEGRAFDLGQQSVDHAIELMGTSGTVIWNGPVGLVEKPAYTFGSLGIARHIARSPKLRSIIGGGDTGAFLRQQPELAYGFDLISRGGGACLELLATGTLPGIEAMAKAEDS